LVQSYGSREAIRCFREQGQGQGVLVNVSSMIGKGGAPFVSAYVATKFAIRGFSESLRQELIDTDIDVVTILPASIDTPLFEHAANFTGRAVKPVEPIYPADDVALAIVKAIRSPRREVFVGNAGRAMAGMHEVAPRAYERLSARMTNKEHFAARSAERTSGNVLEPMAGTWGISGGWRREGEAHKRRAPSSPRRGSASASPPLSSCGSAPSATPTD
jgi:NAD(P)-dependent dehydrogenase (short-subunit alcohol dehydrogenase family)